MAVGLTSGYRIDQFSLLPNHSPKPYNKNQTWTETSFSNSSLLPLVCFPTAPALIGFILHENNQHHTVQM